MAEWTGTARRVAATEDRTMDRERSTAVATNSRDPQSTETMTNMASPPPTLPTRPRTVIGRRTEKVLTENR